MFAIAHLVACCAGDPFFPGTGFTCARITNSDVFAGSFRIFSASVCLRLRVNVCAGSARRRST